MGNRITFFSNCTETINQDVPICLIMLQHHVNVSVGKTDLHSEVHGEHPCDEEASKKRMAFIENKSLLDVLGSPSLHNHVTDYASPDRLEGEELESQIAQVESIGIAADFLDAMPDLVVLLNQDRQIVHANRALLEFLNLNTPDALFGLRPGEAVGCQHATAGPNGCGTSEFCRDCGAVKAILSSQHKRPATQECRITTEDGKALDLRVWATPMMIGREPMTLFVIHDIGDQKRRHSLERIFFNDLLNTAGGLQGYAEILKQAEEQEVEEFATAIMRLANKLIEGIKTQRDLVNAEENDLAVTLGRIHSGDFLADLIRTYKHSEVGGSRYLQTQEQFFICTFTSDRTLLSRVIGNMVCNALEALSTGQMATLGCHDLPDEERIAFTVHNPSHIPNNVQRQIFNRSFSTRGKDRGLGTYAMKLIGEQYLKGKVSFTSDPEAGTTFRIEIPKCFVS